MWYLVGNSCQNVGYTLYAIRYTPTDWKVVNTLSYTVFNIYIMAHLLCAEEYWIIWVTVMECRSALKSTYTDLYWILWTQAITFPMMLSVVVCLPYPTEVYDHHIIQIAAYKLWSCLPYSFGKPKSGDLIASISLVLTIPHSLYHFCSPL